MWLLLLIILNSPPTHIIHAEVMEIHYSEQECVEAVERAMALHPPENTNVGCVYLKGASQAYG